jgi:hypothetical protein
MAHQTDDVARAGLFHNFPLPTEELKRVRQLDPFLASRVKSRHVPHEPAGAQ